MAKRIKDTDYLFISTNLRAQERNLLTAARMERMIEAATAEEAAKVLFEIGYNEFSTDSVAQLGQALAAEREKVFAELYRFAPDKSVVDVFKVKYDYHNAKAALKAQAQGVECSRLLVEAGRMEAEKLALAVQNGSYDALPGTMPKAVKEAAEVLSTTGDPQRSDFVLDQAYYSEMLRCAEQTGSAFLKRYVQVSIDAANLRSAVRTLRLGKGGDFLRRVLFEGGSVPVSRVTSAALSGNIAEPYRTDTLRTAGELGAEAASGGPLTAFEKACDDAVTAVVAEAKHVPFGIEVVIGYLVAKEIEFTAVRIIMSSRMAGIDGDIIRERLRESYV
ncbi:MAG: V-type ATPase subunit [Oscillospiraceae bacterium]|nr:V-type ATPase subunit [Oscillospiraceae bacterium]